MGNNRRKGNAFGHNSQRAADQAEVSTLHPGSVMIACHTKRMRQLHYKRTRIAQEQVWEADRLLAAEEKGYGQAVSFIRGLDTIGRGERVASVCRVTTLGQKRDGSLARQDMANREAVQVHGGMVAWVFRVAGRKGHSEQWHSCLDRVFGKIAELGMKTVVFSSLSRLVRSPHYAKGFLRAKPSPEQFERIRLLAEKHGLAIVTILTPDASFAEERSHETRRSGCQGRPEGTRDRKPGWCKERKERFIPLALEKVDAGVSYREVGAIVNDAMREEGCFVRPISHETIRKWAREMGR